jgi:hypothetical protein
LEQHPVIAVAVQVRGRDQCGQTLDQFQGTEAQLGAPVGLGLGQAIDQLVVAELFEPLQRKRRARAVAQQTLQAGAVGAFDPDRGIQREAPAVVPACHGARIGVVEMADAGEPAQHALAHLLLHRGEVFGCERSGGIFHCLADFARACRYDGILCMARARNLWSGRVESGGILHLHVARSRPPEQAMSRARSYLSLLGAPRCDASASHNHVAPAF